MFNAEPFQENCFAAAARSFSIGVYWFAKGTVAPQSQAGWHSGVWEQYNTEQKCMKQIWGGEGGKGN